MAKWLNRKVLKGMEFREMDDYDYDGFAGAGDDCLMNDKMGDHCVCLADLSFDTETSGFQWSVNDDAGHVDIWFSAECVDVDGLGLDHFTKLQRVLSTSSPARIFKVMNQLGYPHEKLDVHQLTELLERLSKDRKQTHVVADESLSDRLRQAATL